MTTEGEDVAFGSITLDVFQGDDPDENVREMFFKGLPANHTVTAARTGSHHAGGHPEWKITGPVNQILTAALNFLGIHTGGLRNDLEQIFTLLKVDSDDSFDETREGN